MAALKSGKVIYKHWDGGGFDYDRVYKFSLNQGDEPTYENIVCQYKDAKGAQQKGSLVCDYGTTHCAEALERGETISEKNYLQF